MLQRLNHLLAIMLCLCMAVGAVAQPPEGELGQRMLTYRDGLAGTSVTDIITDHSGEMWIATSGGVNIYNGKRLVAFRLGSDTVRNHVYHIYENDCHDIYATSKQGIYRTTFGQEHFKRIAPEISTAETLLPWTGDSIYIANREGLHLYDGRSLQTYRVGDSPMDIANSVRDVKRGPDGRVWFVSKYDLHALNPATGRIESMGLTPQLPQGVSLSRLAMCGDKCYIGTKNDGLYVCRLTDRSVDRIEHVGNVVTSLRRDARGMVCVGTDGSGAYLIDPTDNRIVEHFSANQPGPNRIASNAVYCYYRDDNGVDWFGYFRFGLTHTYHIEHIFRPYRYKDFTTEGLSVRSYAIADDYSLIGTSDGFYFIDPKRDIVSHVTPDQLDGAHIVTSIVRYGDYFFIASYDGGLRRFDPRTMTLSKLPGHHPLDHITVTKLIVNPVRGTLNIGTGEGLFVLRPDGELIRYNEANSKLGGGTVTDISFDAAGNSWLTSEPGLTLYTQGSDQFQRQGFPDDFFNHVRGLRGVQGHDSLQFFYNTDNIYFTDTHLQHYGRLRLPEALRNELCLSFADDRQGHFWVSNERGLFCIDYTLKHMQYFGEGEGIVCRFITDGSLTVDSLGHLWMGTSSGLLSASLDELEQWQQHVRHNVLLYQVRIGGELMSEVDEAVVNDRKQLSLTWNVVSQTLQAMPVVTDYSRSAGRIFEYRVDDDAKWTLIADGRPLSIDNLMLGRHRLTVRMSGLAGTEQTYTVNVRPSALAIAELLLFILGIVLLLWWMRYRKDTRLLLSERDTMEVAIIEMEQAKEQTEQAEERQKYERVKVNEQECELIVRRMRKYLDEQKVYQNLELKMSDLAEVLQLSPSKLSQVFNLYLNENYYDFINGYRLAEFKRRVEAGDNERFTLLALSEQCGFKKSSFFATFRRVEGMTPTEYLKKKHKI